MAKHPEYVDPNAFLKNAICPFCKNTKSFTAVFGLSKMADTWTSRPVNAAACDNCGTICPRSALVDCQSGIEIVQGCAFPIQQSAVLRSGSCIVQSSMDANRRTGLYK